MQPQVLKIKRLDPRAVLPEYKTPGSAGMDLTAIGVEMIEIDPEPASSSVFWDHTADGGRGGPRTEFTKNYSRTNFKYVFSTGLAFEIPEGHVGLIFPRSSIHKYGMQLTNCVGVIDSDYRGEVKFVFRANHGYEDLYKEGDRIGQLVIMKLPEVTIQEVTDLTDTERGTGGFGSTGR